MAFLQLQKYWFLLVKSFLNSVIGEPGRFFSHFPYITTTRIKNLKGHHATDHMIPYPAFLLFPWFIFTQTGYSCKTSSWL